MRPVQAPILSIMAAVFLLAFLTGLLLFFADILHQGYLLQKMFWLMALSLRHWLNVGFVLFLILMPVFLFAATVLNASRRRLAQLGAGFLSISILLLSAGLILYRVTNYPLPPLLRYLHTSLSEPGRREILFKYLADHASSNPGFIGQAAGALIGFLVLFPVVLVLVCRLDWQRISQSFRGTHIRRTAFALLVCLLCLNVAASLEGTLFGADGPDIILIYLDALRADHLGCSGYPPNTSPYIDRLAREGCRFVNVISQAPSTFPSVHSALTSKVASYLPMPTRGCLRSI